MELPEHNKDFYEKFTGNIVLNGQRCKRYFLPLSEGTRQEWSFFSTSIQHGKILARAIRQERKIGKDRAKLSLFIGGILL